MSQTDFLEYHNRNDRFPEDIFSGIDYLEFFPNMFILCLLVNIIFFYSKFYSK